MTSGRGNGGGGRVHKVSLDDLSGVLAELDELADSLEPGQGGSTPASAVEAPADDVVIEVDEPSLASAPSASTTSEADDTALLEELRRERSADERRREEAAQSDAVRLERQRGDDLAAELEALKVRFVKAGSDFEAYKRSLLKEKEDTIRFGSERIIKDILPFLDNLERAIAHGAANTGDQLVDGVRMVHRQMMQALVRYGLEPFDSAAQPFDPRRHQAMSQVSHPTIPPGSVVDDVQRGYFLFGRLLRPALVTVSRGAPADVATAAAAAGEPPPLESIDEPPKGFDSP